MNIKHVFPDKNPFEGPLKTNDKLESILRNGLGLPDFQNVPSEGAAAFLAMSMFPDIDFLRRGILVQTFLRQLLLDLETRVPGASKARVLFSYDGTRTQAEKLAEGKFRWTTGGMSLRSIHEFFDPEYDFDAEMAQKTVEQGFEDVIPLIWEPSQGLSDIALRHEAAQPKTSGASGSKKTKPLTPEPGTPISGQDPNGPGAGRPKGA